MRVELIRMDRRSGVRTVLLRKIARLETSRRSCAIERRFDDWVLYFSKEKPEVRRNVMASCQPRVEITVDAVLR